MFRSKTLFILGAGASAEVGLPIGKGLKTAIARKLSIQPNGLGDQSFINAIQGTAKFYDYLPVAQQLANALPQAISIDNLLDTYRGDVDSETCGKLGIVCSILDAERRSNIHCNANSRIRFSSNDLEETWFAEFVKILTENVSKIEINNIFDNVTIINFNYDRCVEHYLHQSLQNYYKIEQHEATKLMNKLKILHPYGSVGKLPWQDGNNTSPMVRYGSEDVYNLLELAQGIKTFTEGLHDPPRLNEIRSALQQAEIIVFLGFAFHRQNLTLISPDKPCNARRVYATALGISKSDCSVIEEELQTILNQKDQKATIELRNDLKCVELFKEYWRSLTTDL